MVELLIYSFDNSLCWQPILLRGPRRVFLAGGPSHAKLCEGCGGGRVMNARRRQRCLALAKGFDVAPPKALPGSCLRGCERGPDGVAPEKPGVAHAASARMGVAPRLVRRQTSVLVFIQFDRTGVAPQCYVKAFDRSGICQRPYRLLYEKSLVNSRERPARRQTFYATSSYYYR